MRSIENHLLAARLEHGAAEARAHAATVQVLCSAQRARAEFTSAAFRKAREEWMDLKMRLALPQVFEEVMNNPWFNPS